MVDSRPTASVTGKQDWEWNRSRTDRPPAPPARRSPTPKCRPAEQSQPSRRPADEATVHALAAELERTQRRLEAIVDRYERLLEERNRQLEAERPDRTRAKPVWAIVQAVRRWIAGR